ncbi:TetR family transcriptional regulator [Clostridium carboxidivorans P7]|uniref:Transcriptional regulator, TetR family n=1 Tax=Clostridium carboxidivorans P7 TaxID=536227 RepID=C6PTJ0_9CLOT|nr:TetR/AcrR family transcriptional regulator [Clostridium carboxidivorans]AKN31791.1 TetR family transcriptional regulator [Clostridium carboxidivorans P7]EET87420.1 transcriptional regulator, TetR family [Clostridium carboxidivorans P7]EFG87378.1 transcriptional regulator, TetR family [Clostridium carboxidivorans P7]
MSKDAKKNILDAAMKVIAREKISGTRMHMIAKETDRSQANLHYYFPTKNDIMIALLDDIQKQFSENRKQYIDLDNKDVFQNIRGFFEQKEDDILNNKELDYVQLDYWVQGTVNKEIREKFQKTFNIWRSSIKEVLSKGKFKDGADDDYKDMLTYIMVSLMLGASLQYLIDEDKFDLKKYFDAAEGLIGQCLEEEG